MSSFGRSTVSNPAIQGIPSGRQPLSSFVYVGRIKDNTDVRGMGRLKVWIQELCGEDESNPKTWISVSYCSPFAGATNVRKNNNENNYNGTQKSYGFWAVPPDVENDVLCVFANGDISKGYYIGCLYQEQMNWSVPGQGFDDFTTLEPKVEYNRKVADAKNEILNPIRSANIPFLSGLLRQGVDKDLVRGPGNASAKRRGDHRGGDLDYGAAKVYGLSTPRGSQIILDDGELNQSECIRLRTRSGAQIILHETEGLVYISNRDGTAWIELDAEGNIDMFSQSTINIRSESDLNIRSDKNINIEAKMNINMKVLTEDFKLDVFRDIDLRANRKWHQQAIDTMDLRTGKEMRQTAVEEFHVRAGGKYFETAEEIHMNGPTAHEAEEAAKPKTNTKLDVNGFAGNYFQKPITTIVTRLPTHEPCPEHQINSPGYSNGGKVFQNNFTVKKGSTSNGQPRPLNVVGAPSKGMKQGFYEGTAYDSKNAPVYTYKPDINVSGELKSASSFKVGQNGISLISLFEGYQPLIYADTDGKPTIGFGHQLTPQEISSKMMTIGGQQIPWKEGSKAPAGTKGKPEGRGLTREECITLLREDCDNRYGPELKKLIQVPITQNQYDALISFTMNLGAGAVAKTTLIKELNKGNYGSVPNELMKFTNALFADGTKRPLPGLERRRQAEANLFASTGNTNYI